jgi:unsaturated chondroitin disaccharide hydrolase
MQAAVEKSNLEQAFDLCVRKTRSNIKKLADEPKSGAFALDGQYFDFHEGFFDIGNWTSSFFTGMALIAWRATKDDYFLEQTERLAPVYREKVYEQYMDTMHDLGFLYSLYSVALYKLTGSREHREVGLRAAEVLFDRFDPKGNYIRAWGRLDEQDTDYAGLAIVDCLMNLPLLFWASEETGDEKFKDAAVRHADTVWKNFVRDDNSVYHALRFNVETGEITGEDNYCARDVGSHWARGTAWAIYGFALAFRYTKDEKYLDAAVEIARKFAENLGDDGIPVWDFKLQEGEFPLLDTSAASPAVCGIQELEKLGVQDEILKKAKNQMLAALVSGEYLNADENVPGVLYEAEVGDGVGKARTAYTSWGDYYLMEALDVELNRGETWW